MVAFMPSASRDKRYRDLAIFERQPSIGGVIGRGMITGRR